MNGVSNINTENSVRHQLVVLRIGVEGPGVSTILRVANMNLHARILT